MTDKNQNKTAVFEAAAHEIKNIIANAEALEIVMRVQRIISDLSWDGFVIARCKARGFSHQQCANKTGMTKEKVRYYHDKCVELQHDIAIRELFVLK